MKFWGINRIGWGIVLLTICLGMAFLAVSPAKAQDTIVIGQDKVGEVSAANLTPTYIFTAQANQQVTIRVSAVASPIIPQFTIYNASGALVQVVGNPNLGNSVEGVVTFPAAGDYSIQVASVDGSVGQFVLSLLSTEPPTPLLENQPVATTLASGENIVYQFNGNPNHLLELSLEAPDAQVELKNEAGDVLATVNKQIVSSTFLLPLGAEVYFLSLSYNNPESPTLEYQLSLTPYTPADATTAPPPAVELPTTGACVLATRQNSEVNVRDNPSTDAAILSTIQPTQIYSVVGKNSDSSWYQINYGSGTGWVAASVTRRGGNCNSVAVTSTQTAPPVNATPEVTDVTPTTEATVEATAEATPEVTTTQEVQANPVAPDGDQTIEINIKNDSRTVSGAVSYPDGNTQDIITYRVTGFDSVTTAGNVTITAVCTGAGAENARVNFTGGSGGVPCNGASSTQFHTNDSNQGRVQVSLTAGDGAYVNWTLVFSANN